MIGRLPPRRDVACAGCTACCRHEIIFLHPADGDRPETYLTRRVTNPLSGERVVALQQKPNGDCVYLEPERGCSIHERAPVICREFDCARFVAKVGIGVAAKLAIHDPSSRAMLSAGIKRFAAGEAA
jgi:Fe-S-cluster containining protein